MEQTIRDKPKYKKGQRVRFYAQPIWAEKRRVYQGNIQYCHELGRYFKYSIAGKKQTYRFVDETDIIGLAEGK